jgi:predicted CoA-binding protein/ribosomal protein S18 acetylase RimI-like enzyme
VTATYPARREATIVLRDGSTLTIRPVRAEDATDLARFFTDLSLESRVFRFFAAVANADSSIQTMVDVDYTTRYGLVAVAGVKPQIVGHAMYVAIGPRTAEMALAVADAYQGRGLGTILLGQLAEAATAAGFDMFEAVVLPENYRMLQMLRESGFPVRARSEPGEVHAELPTKISLDGIRGFEDRERTAAVAAVTHVLAPQGVAVIGASRQPGSIGAAVVQNLIAYGYRGPLYPVNPSATEIEGIRAFPSVLAIPGDVELAVITVPAAVVSKVARECAEKRVRGLVVISAGFGEVGPAGVDLQRELVDICRQAGMRLVGPNCMGVISTAPDVSLDATFAPDRPVSCRRAADSASRCWRGRRRLARASRLSFQSATRPTFPATTSFSTGRATARRA